MVSDIDQFGRDTTKNNNPSFNEEKSKKILDSLAEIKNQLENKDYNPKLDDSSPRTRASNLKNKWFGTLARQSTCVFPNFTKHEPSA